MNYQPPGSYFIRRKKVRAGSSTILPAGRIYASNANYGGVPIGNDTTGNGKLSTPYQTLTKAVAMLTTGQTIVLGGDPAAPTAYKPATFLTLGKNGLDAVASAGAKLQATSTGAQVMIVNPTAGFASAIGEIIVDGQNLNPQGVELSNTPAALFYVSLKGTIIQNVTQYGLWCTSLACYAVLTMKDCTVTVNSGGRTCVQHRLAAGASLTIENGTYSITDAVVATCLVEAIATAAGASVSITDPVMTGTMSGTFPGATITGVLIQNVSNITLSGGNYTLDGSALAKGVNGITLQTSNDGSAIDMGGFLLEDIVLTVKAAAAGSAKGITIGRDGTVDSSPENGLLDGGTIRRCEVYGADAATQASGHHAFLIASHSDAALEDCIAEKCYLGFGIKEAAATINGGTVRDFTQYGVIYKASRTGCVVEGVTTISVSGNSAARHVDAHSNGDGLPSPGPSDTGNNCAGTIHRNNFHINDGGTGIIFVDVDAGQDVTLSGNTYFNRSGTLDQYPWRYHGVNYSTFAAYQAAVEPDAVWADPDA